MVLKYKKISEESDLTLLKEHEKKPFIFSINEIILCVFLIFLWSFNKIIFWILVGLNVCWIVFYLFDKVIPKSVLVEDELKRRGLTR